MRQVADGVKIPVIASGGAGNYTHMLEALTQGRASAVAAASIFHFTQQTPKEAKEYLAGHGILVRNVHAGQQETTRPELTQMNRHAVV